MQTGKTVELANALGDTMEVPLTTEGMCAATTLRIDGVQYHFERIPKEQLISDYRVDGDPDYQPHADAEGYCYVLAPFSK